MLSLTTPQLTGPHFVSFETNRFVMSKSSLAFAVAKLSSGKTLRVYVASFVKELAIEITSY